MNIQSLSVVVPNPKCINSCKFCVSRQHCGNHKNLLDENLPDFHRHLEDYLKRLEFARSNGCNTVMLTGCSEPQQNRKFLAYFGMFQRMMRDPFQWVEMQTTGILLDRGYLQFLRDHVGVNVISISVSSFYQQLNADIIGMPEGHEVWMSTLCPDIKELGMTLRLSLNLTDALYPDSGSVLSPEELFDLAQIFHPDQVTLRGMYDDGGDSPQAQWVREHRLDPAPFMEYIRANGAKLGVLPYGTEKWSIRGMTTVLDSDCMAKAEPTGENYKYLILQPDCKLYSLWDDPASLIF